MPLQMQNHPNFPEECAREPALIRTLVLKPDIMLLDEPFSALDYQTRLNVSDDIRADYQKREKNSDPCHP